MHVARELTGSVGWTRKVDSMEERRGIARERERERKRVIPRGGEEQMHER